MSKVFVVDDDFEVRSSLCPVIETKGFSAQGFSSAADFRARYQPEYMGCLVIDKALQLGALWRRRDQEFSDVKQRMAALTSRESETLELILAGESNTSTAAKLFISERVVEMRRYATMCKLEVRSLAELLNVTVTHRVLVEFLETELRSPSGT